MIETPEILYEYFELALNSCLNGPKKRERKAIAVECGFTVQFLGQLIHPTNPKKVPSKRRPDIAKACGYTYEQFLELGKSIKKNKKPDSIDKTPSNVAETSLPLENDKEVEKLESASVKRGKTPGKEKRNVDNIVKDFNDRIEKLNQTIQDLTRENERLKAKTTPTTHPLPGRAGRSKN